MENPRPTLIALDESGANPQGRPSILDYLIDDLEFSNTSPRPGCPLATGVPSRRTYPAHR